MLVFSSLQSGMENVLAMIIAMVMAVFVAMPIHEFSHAFAARCEGDYTAVACKRYTLAPLAHFDWKGFLFLMLFGFGWAKPVPVDSRNFKNGRKSQFKVAIAGIISNILLGIIFLFIYMLIIKTRPMFFGSSFYGELLYQFLNYSISLNFMIAFFNLLPIYPLDGYKIVDSCCRYENGFLKFMKSNSFLIYLILVVTGLYSVYYEYTANALIGVLIKLFSWILGM